jgi:hypothetical protein
VSTVLDPDVSPTPACARRASSAPLVLSPTEPLVDGGSAEQLERSIQRLLADGHRHLVVDLDGVPRIDGGACGHWYAATPPPVVWGGSSGLDPDAVTVPDLAGSADRPLALTNPFLSLLKLVVAALIGLLITVVHRPASRDKPLTRSMEQTQVLLCVSGARS